MEIYIFFQKVTFQISLMNFMLLKKLKILCCGHMFLLISTVKHMLGRFTNNNCKKTNPIAFRMEKVIKRKDDKLYVKWISYDNPFSSWIDKNGIFI